MNNEAKRTALRMFTYGLYALTVADGAQGHAATVNWVTQVSFEPTMLAVSVEKGSKSLRLIRQSRSFAINIFRADQRELAGQLGRKSVNRPDKFQGIAWKAGLTGSPLLTDALAAIECRFVSEVDAGDSVVVVAEVVEAAVVAEGKPLTMEATGFKHAG